MHIALISEHASPLAAPGGVDAGGQNVYVAQTARLLSLRGHIVDVYTRRTSAEPPESITLRPGLRVIHVSAGPPEEIPKEALYEHMEDFTAAVIARMRRENPPDVVHAHFWMSGMTAAAIRERLGVPFVITFHALGRVRRMHQGQADGFPDERVDIERALMREASCVIAECPQDVDDMRTLYGAEVASVVEVPCGFDPGEMGPVEKRLAREMLGIDPDTRVVLLLGRMVPRKGADDAIRGFARATEDTDENALLLIVGGDATDSSVADRGEGARLLSIARLEGAEDRVRFVGAKSRALLRYYYSAADLFVSVPWYEPFGITPVEAMACGTPVLGSRVGGIKHTVVDEVTGLLVEPHDPNAVARAIRRILADDGLRDRMGRAGRERVHEQFTWNLVTEALDTVYRSAARPPRAAELIAAAQVGRFGFERGAVPALSLSSDAPALTALADDCGLEHALERQVGAFSDPNGLPGRDGGEAAELCDVPVVVPTEVTARIQEAQQFLIHHPDAAVDDAYLAMLSTIDPSMSTGPSEKEY